MRSFFVVSLLFVVSSLFCFAGAVLAGEAEDAALATHEIRQKYCAEAATEKNTEVAKALNEIMPVFVQVSEVYDATGEDFLLYWRGVLQECIGRADLANQDLDAFLASEQAVASFPDLASDARRRLRRMRSAAARGAISARGQDKAPLFLLGFAGGYGLVAVPDIDPFHYAIAQADLSIRLVGPLRVLAHARLGFSETYDEFELDDPEAQFLSLLTVFGAGVEVRIPGPVSPRFGALLQLAPNPDEHEDFGGAEEEYGGAFLVGAAALIGIDIPMGTSAISLRPQAEVGFLSTSFSARFTLGAAFGFP
jgi:hypothetical protein